MPDNPKTNKTASLGIRVAPQVKAALDAAAAADNRSVASLVEKVLIDWLKSKGLLLK
jgi:predicted HicB family RNase H-like nuclease